MLAKRLFLLLLLPYVLWLAIAYDYHFLDGVNLLFHEGGHIFLSFFGETIHVLGGTIGQLFFPAACAFHFLQRRQLFESWLMGIWFAESLMYTARYLGDAQAQVLPLVGGDIHDWHWLLSHWGLLAHCEGIAATLHVFASLLAFGCLVGAFLSTATERDEDFATIG
jgi:hypothetical protein